jgi:hypothetical protein
MVVGVAVVSPIDALKRYAAERLQPQYLDPVYVDSLAANAS